MMDNLRAASNHVVLKILLALIILSFVLTGVGNYLTGGNGDYAAKVNGDEISRAQLERAVMNERTRQQQQLGEQFSQLAGNAGYLQHMRQQALGQLIDQKLLEQYAKKLRLAIGDGQIKQAIFTQPAFQKDGKFDNATYLAVINSMRLTADDYAEALRKQLTMQQLITSLTDTDFMLPAETDRLMSLVAQQRQIRQATFDVGVLARNQSVTPEEINNRYEQNKNSFMSPEQFRVSYIKLDAAAMQKDASENDIQAWYEKHQQDYTQPQRNRYSIIQSKTEADAQAVLDQLKKGGDFAELAKTKSTDPISSRAGGDIGWLEAATTPDELNHADLKKKGQLSGVIKSSVGFIVARLDDIKPQQIKPLATVRNDIASRIKQENALDTYFKLQQQVSDAASNDNESLTSAEEVAGVKVQETPWFDHDSVPADINFPQVVSAIFNGNLLGDNGMLGRNSEMITVDGDRAFVLRIDAHKPEQIKPLTDVTAEITAMLKREKAYKIAKARANDIMIALKAGKGEQAMKEAGLHFGSQQLLPRNGQDPLTATVFAMTPPAKGNVSYGVGEDVQGNVVLLALDEVKSGTLPDAQKQALISGMTQNNAQIAFDALLTDLRKNAKIKYGVAAQME